MPLSFVCYFTKHKTRLDVRGFMICYYVACLHKPIDRATNHVTGSVGYLCC